MELTKREASVLEQWRKGKRKSEIARTLHMSHDELSRYTDSLLKLGAMKKNDTGYTDFTTDYTTVHMRKQPKPERKRVPISSSFPKLKYAYGQPNNEVTTWNYKTLPPNDPRRIQIEQTQAEAERRFNLARGVI